MNVDLEGRHAADFDFGFFEHHGALVLFSVCLYLEVIKYNSMGSRHVVDGFRHVANAHFLLLKTGWRNRAAFGRYKAIWPGIGGFSWSGCKSPTDRAQAKGATSMEPECSSPYVPLLLAFHSAW